MGRGRFLFLQGMATTYFMRLGKALAARGHVVRRINFNGGDRLFWAVPDAADFTGDLDDWPDYLTQKLAEWRITDIVLFGDCRPLHQVASNLARQQDIQVHVFEEGYLRPNWITLEPSGVNGHSTLGNNPNWYREHVAATPAWTGGTVIRNSFCRRSVEDVLYNVATSLFARQFPGYRTHRPWHWSTEYASWFKRIIRSPASNSRLRKGLRRLAVPGTRYFVFPLQLDSDSQIRIHSSFKRMVPAIEQVIESFARYAPNDRVLVVKEHPLDNAMTDWRVVVERAATRLGIADRVLYIAGGRIEHLVSDAEGVVTINSTVGIVALSFGRPLIALGKAIYNIPELTFSGSLDEFWRAPAAPNPETFDAFRRVVAARTQLNGGFFSDFGLKLAVTAAVERLEALCRSSPIGGASLTRQERVKIAARPKEWAYPTSDTDFVKS